MKQDARRLRWTRIGSVTIAWLFLFNACNSDTPPSTDFQVTPYAAESVVKDLSTPVFAHYMPWFSTPEVSGYWGIHWTMSNASPSTILSNGRRDIASHYYPTVGPYDSRDADYLEYALICMKLSGIDGIFIDYYGKWPYNDYPTLLEATHAVVDACERVGLQFALVYEDRTLQEISNQGGGNPVDLAREDFTYIEQNFFSRSHYFRLDGEPVLLNFGPITLQSNADWLQVHSGVAQSFHFLPLGYHPQYYSLTTCVDGVYAWVGEVETDDVYTYASQFNYTGGGALFEFKEYYEEGGWGSTGQVDIPTRNGDLLRETLDRAIAQSSDFIQLITWNDWGEGTAMEPSLDYGYQALSIVQDRTGVTYDSTDLSLAVRYYELRKSRKSSATAQAKLDQVFYYLISLDLDAARGLLEEVEG